MSHDPSTHENQLPSALSNLGPLFSSEEGHFLQPPGDGSDILMDTSLGDQVPSPHHDSVIEEQRAADAAAVEAAGTTLELAESETGTPDLSKLRDDNVHLHQSGSRARGGGRKTDPNAVEVTSASLRVENERLRKIIAVLEGRLSMPSGPTSTAIDSLTEQDGGLLPQHTLRELASAAVGEAALSSFEFESLQQHLETHAHETETGSTPHQSPHHNIGISDETAAAIVNAANDGILAVHPSDFLHGLVTSITASQSQHTSTPESDPFKTTYDALQADIIATRAEIAAKESEINAIKSGMAESLDQPSEGRKDRTQAELTRTTTILDETRKAAAVLHDITARLQDSCDKIQEEVKLREAELSELVFDDDGEDERAFEAQRALVEVRSYVEGMVKTLKEKGALPPAPLPPIPLLLRSDAPLQTPPSALPKKRGRPPRAAPKPSVVPPQLAHLIPDAESVKAREQDTPIRRKGIKRNKIELERERQREEEEGEMLRNLVGMGVWTREDGYTESPVES